MPEERASPTGRGPLEGAPGPEERGVDAALRPRSFAEYIGQTAVLDKLRVYLAAAKRRGEPLDHALFCGPPGLGKTSLAHLIAAELGVAIHVTSGPAIERKGDLAGILTNLGRGQILFIDEIHRLPAPVEETLYPAMEDFQLDVIFESGPSARTLKLPLERFTLIGATTRGGLLTSPLRDRFQIVERLDYYEPSELATIVARSAGLLGIEIEEAGAQEIGRRARGTPRIANRLLRRIRDFAEVQGDGRVTARAASAALARLEVDELGCDAMDRRILRTIAEKFDGGLLTSPLRDRFQIVERLDYYEPSELATIVARSAGLLGIEIEEAGAQEIGRRARGTPRIANRLLRRIRDFAEVQGDGRVTERAASAALARLEVDELGCDAMDRRILRTIAEKFDGGPVGLETLAASVGEERETIEDVYEPFLLQRGLLQRTPRGRLATVRAYAHLGLPPGRRPGGELF